LHHFYRASIRKVWVHRLSTRGGKKNDAKLTAVCIEKLKGLQTLLPLFQHYHRAQLWVAGTGSYEPQLRRLVAESDNIRFLGWLSERHLPTLYRQAVAVIVPSLCLEFFSLVSLEALRQRTLVIVRNRGVCQNSSK